MELNKIFTEDVIKLLDFLEGDIPLESRPFLAIAEKLGYDEESVVKLINKLLSDRVIKRLGAVVKHTKVGFVHNAMVVWKMNTDQVNLLREFIVRVKGISHAYVRKVYPGIWEYNVYTMLHARNEGELSELIEEISDHTGCDEYRVLRTIKEFKKSSPKYVR